jgi:Tfp pilus assembly protein PilF
MDPEARVMLEKAIEFEPGLAAPHHALGLLLVRARQPDEALAQLRKAAELEPGSARYAYVYGVALYGQGRREEGVAVLESTLQRHPRDPDVVSALLAYYHEMGEAEKLRALEMQQHPR